MHSIALALVLSMCRKALVVVKYKIIKIMESKR